MDWLEKTCFFERAKSAVRDDDVIQHLDAQDFPGLEQAAGQFNVVLARRRISGRVAMGQDDTGRAHEDGHSKDLARVND